jgi:hypothetical protein
MTKQEKFSESQFPFFRLLWPSPDAMMSDSKEVTKEKESGSPNL